MTNVELVSPADPRKAIPSVETAIVDCQTWYASLAMSKSSTVHFYDTPHNTPLASLTLFVNNWGECAQERYCSYVTEQIRAALSTVANTDVSLGPCPIEMAHPNCADIVRDYFHVPKEFFEADGRAYFALMDLYVGDVSPARSKRYVEIIESRAAAAIENIWDCGAFTVTEIVGEE